MKTRNALLVLATIFLISVLAVLFALTQGRAIYMGRASGSTYSLSNSYVFASPLSAKSPTERIRVTVFLLDEKGRGVAGKEIYLKTNPAGVNFSAVQSITDKMGQAVYDLATATPGKYVVEAQTDGNSLPQTVTVKFE